MSAFFWGFLLVILEFDITLESKVIGFLPDFLGFFFLLQGAKAFENTSERFVRIKPWLIAMVAISAGSYGLDLFGLSSGSVPFNFILIVCYFALTIFIQYSIIMGIMDIDAGVGEDLKSKELYDRWMFVAGCQGLILLVILIPVLFLPLFILTVIATIVFLLKLSETSKRYDAYKNSVAP